MVDSLPIHALSASASMRSAYNPSRTQQNDLKRRRPFKKTLPLCVLFGLVIIILLVSSTTGTKGSSYIAPLFALSKSSSSFIGKKHVHHHIHPPLDYVHNSNDSKEASPAATDQNAASIMPEAHEQPSYNIYRPLIISGPSGVGKGTLINKVVEFYGFQDGNDASSNKNDFGFSVSHTTRGPRPGEVEGIHYHFTDRQEMEQGIQAGIFIEHAEVHGNLYGTSFEAVQNVASSGRICILDIDIQGAKRVKEGGDGNSCSIEPHYIFVAPPSMQALEQRLRDRGTETEKAILRRIGNAAKEVEYGTAPGNFDEVVVNDDLEQAFIKLRHILEEFYPHLQQVPSN